MDIYNFYLAIMLFPTDGKALLYFDNDSMTDKYNKGFHFQKTITIEKANEIIKRYKLKLVDKHSIYTMYTVTRYLFR